MNIRLSKTLVAGVSTALAMLCAWPAAADDTELMLVNPDPDNRPSPNVLFILDTSGSMDTREETTKPYDSTLSYPGTCDADSYYWSDVDVAPACDGTETQKIAKSSFKCDYAALQLDGIGNYSNTLVQYRFDALGVVKSWQDLEPGDSTDVVECEDDSGSHGDGTPGEVYAPSSRTRSP